MKSFKTHLRVVGNYKLDFEEMSTVLAQVEACLNSRPLGTVPCNDEEGIEMLTPGHFLIGRPIQAIPDHTHSSRSLGLLSSGDGTSVKVLLDTFGRDGETNTSLLYEIIQNGCVPRTIFKSEMLLLKKTMYFLHIGPLPESSKPMLELMD